MTTITLHEAQLHLPELVHRLLPGEELLITDNDRPVARLSQPLQEPPRKTRQFGTLRGTVISMDRFDDPLEEFAEYS